MRKRRLDWKVLLFLYVLCIVLLWEWFIPIMELTDFGYPSLFLLYLVLFFVLALLDVAWWLSGVLQILYVLWTVHYIYFDQLFFSMETIGLIFTDIVHNLTALIQGEVGELSNLFRTLLLYTLIWMIAYLIRHWIEVRHSMMLFFAITVVFVALLDTFSPYDASASIVRIMMVGLLIVGYLTLIKLAREERITLRPVRLLLLSLPLVLIVSSVGLASRKAPVQPPAWPDPVPFLLSKSGVIREDGGAGTAKAGYDQDDSRLGGAFIQDHQLVFEADVEKRQYWRIETKDTYTSKGWEQSPDSSTEVLPVNQEVFYYDGEDPLVAKLDFEQRLPFLAVPYGVQKISHPYASSVLHEVQADRMYMQGIQDELDSYEVEFMAPVYPMSELKRADMMAYETVEEQLNDYLQLPDTLPERVRDLAAEITSDKESVYDKAKSVEQYFKRNGFIYDTQDVAVPAEDQDYVDQFLFDTKKGYCDNFSTSMVVMLRSSGIPARWVKGFAPGQQTYKASGKNVYRVTNDEAHSWVEAFIPGVGWMPFEPTIGFSHPTNIDFDVSSDPEEEQIKETPKKPEVEQAEKKKKQARPGNNFFAGMADALAWFFTRWWLYVGIAVIAGAAGIFAYRRKGRWLPKWKVRQFGKQQDGWQKFEEQYMELLRQLGRAGIPKEPGMTLSMYAIQVDEQFGGERMRLLTAAYEKGIYGNDRISHNWKQLNEVWEDLIITAAC